MIERNITNLANQPASGGMPASDARNIVIVDRERRATSGTGPSYDEISALRVRRATAITTANAPRFIAP